MNIKIRNLILLYLLCLLTATATAQKPVNFTVQQRQTSPTELEVVFTGRINAGWHVYSTNLGSGGPTSAALKTETLEGLQPVGSLRAIGREIENHDPVFDMKVRFFENMVQFIQKFQITAPVYHVKGFLRYGACNDHECMPPTRVEFDYTGKGTPEKAAATAEKAKEEPQTAEKDENKKDTVTTSINDLVTVGDTLAADTTVMDAGSDLWTPVIEELKAFDKGEDATHSSWFYVFIMGFVGGLLALFTPCVWPIIPMTVSFFLKRSENKRRGIRDAITYGISIIVIYLTLGILVAGLFGPETLNGLATNAVFNIFFFLLLIVFACSFFGWFELTLPSKWTNSVDSKANKTTGLLSIFLMAFTLALVSFSCTAPIVGLLLVQTVSSANLGAPIIGMLGFAIALALPFTLFALFPAWLKQAPKSGAWMNIIKVTLGFIELAFALKFFSVADLAYGWGLLDREVFLSLWIAIFLLLGLYLIGVYKFPSDMPNTASTPPLTGEARRGLPKPMPVACILMGLASIAFSIYMVPGLWGAPCKAVSAFAPPMSTQDFNLYHQEVTARYTDYEEGMAAAAREGKPVLLDFTGFGCVNCRKMEAAVWTDPAVAEHLKNDYILISLYVDDKRPLATPIEVNDNGEKRTLRTIGDKWAYLEQYKFGHLTQPFYVAVNPQGKPLTKAYSYDEDISKYLEFLEEGLSN